MLKLHSNLEGMKVMSFQLEKAVAYFEDLVVKPENAQVLGMFVRQKNFFKSTRKFILTPDILEISNAIYVQNESSLVSPSEIIRLKNIEEDYFSLIDLSVENKSGKKLGKISDYVFDTLTGQILKFHISPGLAKFQQTERIVSIEKVYSLSKEKLVIESSDAKVKSKAKPLLSFDGALSSEARYSTKEST